MYINIFKKQRFRFALFIAVTTTSIHQQSSIEKKFNWIKPISTFYVFFISIDDNGMTLTTSWAAIIIAASELRGVFSAIKRDQSKALHSVLFFHPPFIFLLNNFHFSIFFCFALKSFSIHLNANNNNELILPSASALDLPVSFLLCDTSMKCSITKERGLQIMYFKIFTTICVH